MREAVLKKPFYWLFGFCIAASGAVGLFAGMYMTGWVRLSLGALPAFLLSFPLVGALSFAMLYAPVILVTIRRSEREQQVALEKPLVEWGILGVVLSGVLSLLLATGVVVYAIWNFPGGMHDSM